MASAACLHHFFIRSHSTVTNARVRQMYLPDTNILITRFLADEGVAELTDYMPIESDGGEPNEIVRKVAVIRGGCTFPDVLRATFAAGPGSSCIPESCAGS